MSAKRISTAGVDKLLYVNYWTKAVEFRESMRQSLIARNWNAASLNAIHAGISANDAVIVCFHGLRSISSKHEDAVRLLKSVFKDDKAKKNSSHLTRLINAKNIVEYESRLFTQSEAYSLSKHLEKFMEWVEAVLPKK